MKLVAPPLTKTTMSEYLTIIEQVTRYSYKMNNPTTDVGYISPTHNNLNID